MKDWERSIPYALSILFAATMPLTHITGYGAGVIALCVAWRSRARLLREPVVMSLIALIAYGGVRTIASAEPVVGSGAVFGYIAHWLMPFVLGYLSVADDARRTRTLFLIFSGGFGVLCAVSVAAYTGLVPPAYTIPGLGTFIFVEDGLLKGLRSHISLASVCLVLLFVWLELGRGLIARRTAYAAAAASLIALVLTGSRGYYIALLAGLGGYGAYRVALSRSVRPVLMGVLAVLVLAGTAWFAVPTLRERIQHTGLDDNNVRERLALYRVAWDEVRARPLFGFGSGQGILQTEFFGNLPVADRSVSRHPHLHSFYLNFAADTGIVGLGLFLAVLCALFSGLRAAASGPADPFSAGFARGLAWGLAGILVAECFDTLLLGPWTAMEVFWLAGLALGGRTLPRSGGAA